jgi:hypothetical protein
MMERAKGNKCGHDPRSPRLSPASPIRKGKGGLPRILSLAAERAKAWYFHPKKCKLLQSHPNRKTRSERREACQIVIETILSHLDLASLCLGAPTLENGFIDIDMKTLVATAGIGQRRIELAIVLLKDAGFLEVTQPRTQNDQGDYYGCRAIRVLKAAFFEWLDLGPMLETERRKASARLQRRAQKANRKLSVMMRRLTKKLPYQKQPQPADEEAVRRWNIKCAEYFIQGLDGPEAKRRTNADLGYPPDYSPGQAYARRIQPAFSRSR